MEDKQFDSECLKALLQQKYGNVTGHWMITPNFFQYVDKQIFDSIHKDRKKRAFKKGMNYISMQNLIETEEEEYRHFYEHYRIIFSELPELHLSAGKIDLITKDLVFNYEKYSFFDDAKVVIPQLSERYKLAVVSDAWPSLEGVFKEAGMRAYFSSFVISSILGVTKPDEAMYKTALEELKVSPDEVIFIDDNVRNCYGAKKVGIEETFLLCRDIRMFIFCKFRYKDHKVIRNLMGLKKYKII